MSSGIRDAGNLCWKLDLVLRGKASDEILRSYAVERREHVEKMTRLALRLGRVLQTRSRTAAAVRNLVFRLATRLPVISTFLSRGEFKPSALFPEGLIVDGRRRSRNSGAGTLFPQPEVLTSAGDRSLLDELLGSGFAVLGLASIRGRYSETPTWRSWRICRAVSFSSPSGIDFPQRRPAATPEGGGDGDLFLLRSGRRRPRHPETRPLRLRAVREGGGRLRGTEVEAALRPPPA